VISGEASASRPRIALNMSLALKESGVPVVKVALNADAGPTLTDEELVAICDAAHAAEAIVTCHAQGKGQVERALGAGVDELAHCPWSESLSDDVVAGLAARMRIVSTLDIHSFGEDTPDLRRATDNLNRFLQAGGRVTYGTDLGNGAIPPGIHVGEAWHLRRAGLARSCVRRVCTCASSSGASASCRWRTRPRWATTGTSISKRSKVRGGATATSASSSSRTTG